MVRSVAEARQKHFRTVTGREGTKGAMRSRFLALRVQPAHGYVEGKAPGLPIWLLVEWPRQEAAPTKHFLCDLPADCSLRRLVQLTKERSRVEQDYQQMKEELGLDHWEGRSWTGLASSCNPRDAGACVSTLGATTEARQKFPGRFPKCGVNCRICLGFGPACVPTADARLTLLLQTAPEHLTK